MIAKGLAAPRPRALSKEGPGGAPHARENWGWTRAAVEIRGSYPRKGKRWVVENPLLSTTIIEVDSRATAVA